MKSRGVLDNVWMPPETLLPILICPWFLCDALRGTGCAQAPVLMLPMVRLYVALLSNNTLADSAVSGLLGVSVSRRRLFV